MLLRADSTGLPSPHSELEQFGTGSVPELSSDGGSLGSDNLTNRPHSVIEESKVVQKFRVRLLKGDGEWAKFRVTRLTHSFSSKEITKQDL